LLSGSGLWLWAQRPLLLCTSIWKLWLDDSAHQARSCARLSSIVFA
jgi:hypothetical protein